MACLFATDFARSRTILLHPGFILPTFSSIGPHPTRGVLVEALGILHVQRNHRRRHGQLMEHHVRRPLRKEGVICLSIYWYLVIGNSFE